MKTTKQILETESFQCMPDGFDVLINKKWYSEEEIMNVLNKIVNWDNCSEVNYNPLLVKFVQLLKKNCLVMNE